MKVDSKLSSLINFLLCVVVLISSFDIFLNIPVMGFSVRASYLLIIIIAFFYFFTIPVHRKSIKIISFPFLFIWLSFIFIFIPNTVLPSRSIGYFGLLVIHCLIILFFGYYVNNEMRLARMIRFYFFSFYFLSIVGLVQFCLGIIGIDFFVEQWWIYKKLPRLNAFSYEPSYYATYLQVGWGSLFYLYLKKDYVIIEKKKVNIYFFLVTLAIILSSSRLGILFLVFQGLFLFSYNILKGKISSKFLYLYLSGFLVVFILATMFIVNLDKVKFLLEGTGVQGTASHSSSTRMYEMESTFHVFLESPIIGVSLGGVSPAVGKLRGKKIKTQEDAKKAEGMNIFFEVLAASGIIGYLFFIGFFISLYNKLYKLAHKIKDLYPHYSILIKSLMWALTFELLILIFNQNILRVYLWVHLGIINAVYFNGIRLLKEQN